MPEQVPLSALPEVNQVRDAELFEELRGESERLLDRHMGATKEWDPHMLVPYELGRNYNDDPYNKERDNFLTRGAASALIVNTLTEDNLPEYFRLIANHADGATHPNHPFMDWAKQWKAEEDRHGSVMDEWVNVTRAVDPSRLQRDRMKLLATVEDGVPQFKTVTELLAYTALQELATGVSHRNTGRAIGNETEDGRKHGGQRMLAVIAGDEGRHFRFYADMAGAALRKDPETMTIALARQIVGFQMPGNGIAGFNRHAAVIARSGIYGLPEYRNEVLQPVLERLQLNDMRAETLSKEGQLAHTAIIGYIEALDAEIAKQKQRGLLS